MAVGETTDLLGTLGARIDARRDELVALTQDLIRIPTVNPPGEFYRDACELLAARLGSRGFETAFYRARGAPGDSDRYPRWNVVARREGRAPGPCIHFNGHVDVVEAGAGWTRPPFAATVADGRVWGRGACDMKGGLAAAIIAIEAYIDVFPGHAGAIEVSGTADEESGGYGGVAWLAEMGILARPRVDHVIIPEPLDKHRICLGHRGVWWAEIETRGRMAHGSMPFLGDSAVRHMAAVLEAFEREIYPALARRVTAMPVVPDGARASCLNVNSIHGGQGEAHAGLPSPCVADSCRMVIDRRFLIEESPDKVKAEIRELLDRLGRTRPGFSYRLEELLEVAPTLADRNGPVVRAVAHSIAAVLGREPEYVVSPGTYDHKHVARIGRIGDCIAYGPGILDLAHQPDEYVIIDDMLDSAKVMGLAMHGLLTGAGH